MRRIRMLIWAETRFLPSLSALFNRRLNLNHDGTLGVRELSIENYISEDYLFFFSLASKESITSGTFGFCDELQRRKERTLKYVRNERRRLSP